MLLKIVLDILIKKDALFMKIHHFGIQVKDIDQSISFYIEKLGFVIKTPKTLSEDGAYLYANLSLKNSDSELELVQIMGEIPLSKADSLPPICPHIGLESFDFEHDLQMLKEKGVPIFDGPYVFFHDVKILTILDPDHYRIDIGQKIQ
jgi:catechol 2,3-dioxygenase-like lactoylglutathione lyase family enzyme